MTKCNRYETRYHKHRFHICQYSNVYMKQRDGLLPRLQRINWLWGEKSIWRQFLDFITFIFYFDVLRWIKLASDRFVTHRSKQWSYRPRCIFQGLQIIKIKLMNRLSVADKSSCAGHSVGNELCCTESIHRDRTLPVGLRQLRSTTHHVIVDLYVIRRSDCMFPVSSTCLNSEIKTCMTTYVLFK